jgi:hypothetical protein
VPKAAREAAALALRRTQLPPAHASRPKRADAPNPHPPQQALREASRAQGEQQLKEVPDICLRKFLSTSSDEELRHMRMLASLCGLTYYMGTKVTVRFGGHGFPGARWCVRGDATHA